MLINIVVVGIILIGMAFFCWYNYKKCKDYIEKGLYILLFFITLVPIVIYYLDRYISTGVENFRIKKYFNGILIGYILQGDKLNIINELNFRLLNNLNTIQEIRNSNFLPSCSDIYHSKHQTPTTDSIEIKHIFAAIK